MKKILLLLFATCPLFAQTAQIDELIAAYSKLYQFNGTALVAQHGQILLQKGYGWQDESKQLRNDANSTFLIASVTKTFTAGLVLELVKRHKLSLTDKISIWFPEFPNADKITIAQLLSHTSGIYDYTRGQADEPLDSEKKMMGLLAAMPLDFEPGTDWGYSNSGYSILGFIIGKVSGMSYEKALQHYIFKPFGMRHSGTGFETLDVPHKAVGYSVISADTLAGAPDSDSKVVFAAGAIYSTVGDMYEWHKSLQSFKIADKELLSLAYTPVKRNYGYGWIIDSINQKKVVYHSGNIAGFSSLFLRVPEDDICIVLLNNREGGGLEEIGRKILDILYHKSYDLPRKITAIKLPAAVLENYIGTYRIADIDLTLEISMEGAVLRAHAVNGPTFDLTPEKENIFFIDAGKAEIEFLKDAKGTVYGLALTQNDQRKEGLKIK